MLKIENTEVKMWDKHDSTIVECGIKGSVFLCLRKELSYFNSEIYKYSDLCVIVNREPRFGEFYYSIAVYNEVDDRAWPLLTLPAKFDINVKRLNENMFVLWTDSQEHSEDIKQCTFCKLHDAEKQDNITIDFNSLKGIHFLPEKRVLIAFAQVLGGTPGVEKRLVNTLALYEPSGKLIETIYEYYEDDSNTFDYELNLETGKLFIIKKVKNSVKSKKPIDISDLANGSVSSAIND